MNCELVGADVAYLKARETRDSHEILGVSSKVAGIRTWFLSGIRLEPYRYISRLDMNDEKHRNWKHSRLSTGYKNVNIFEYTLFVLAFQTTNVMTYRNSEAMQVCTDGNYKFTTKRTAAEFPSTKHNNPYGYEAPLFTFAGHRAAEQSERLLHAVSKTCIIQRNSYFIPRPRSRYRLAAASLQGGYINCIPVLSPHAQSK